MSCAASTSCATCAARSCGWCPYTSVCQTPTATCWGGATRDVLRCAVAPVYPRCAPSSVASSRTGQISFSNTMQYGGILDCTWRIRPEVHGTREVLLRFWQISLGEGDTLTVREAPADEGVIDKTTFNNGTLLALVTTKDATSYTRLVTFESGTGAMDVQLKSDTIGVGAGAGAGTAAALGFYGSYEARLGRNGAHVQVEMLAVILFCAALVLFLVLKCTLDVAAARQIHRRQEELGGLEQGPEVRRGRSRGLTDGELDKLTVSYKLGNLSAALSDPETGFLTALDTAAAAAAAAKPETPPGTTPGRRASPEPAFASPLPLDVCSICLSPFALGETLRLLRCGHAYHAACSQEWLSRKGVCPMCKMLVRPEDGDSGDGDGGADGSGASSGDGGGRRSGAGSPGTAGAASGGSLGGGDASAQGSIEDGAGHSNGGGNGDSSSRRSGGRGRRHAFISFGRTSPSRSPSRPPPPLSTLPPPAY